MAVIFCHPLPSVYVLRHEPDLEDPAAPVWAKLESLADDPPTCLFINPIGTASCEAGTPEFYRQSRKLQAQWCRRYKQTFGRRVVLKVRDWASWKTFPDRDSRYTDRAATFTGLLLIDGQLIPPRKWPDRRAKRQHSTTHPIQPTAKITTS